MNTLVLSFPSIMTYLPTVCWCFNLTWDSLGAASSCGQRASFSLHCWRDERWAQHPNVSSAVRSSYAHLSFSSRRESLLLLNDISIKMQEEDDRKNRTLFIFFFYLLYHALLWWNHQVSAGRKSAFISLTSGFWAQIHLLALSIITQLRDSTVLALQNSRDIFFFKGQEIKKILHRA